MSEEQLINEQVNRLSYIQAQPEIASGTCGPFQVNVFADREYELGRSEEYARQTAWYPDKDVSLYFSGLAVRITKPDTLDATGVEYFYTPVIDAQFNMAERVDWLDEKGEWRDVSEPFSFVTAHGPESPRWEKIYNSPFGIPGNTFPNAFWSNQFVYSLPYGNLLEHVSRYAEPGDRFRIVKPHPVQLRWQGKTCTIPVPDVEFRVTGRKEG
ncbi:MAG: hypothetical protein Q4G26_07475 [Paracoccus sp. (in: a-proteobacteria)]|nr:hypothetical protein [Paracoccus sp. (in: a-proteobacteria)]